MNGKLRKLFLPYSLRTKCCRYIQHYTLCTWIVTRLCNKFISLLHCMKIDCRRMCTFPYCFVILTILQASDWPERFKAWNGSLIKLYVKCDQEKHCVLVKLESIPNYSDVCICLTLTNLLFKTLSEY